ncbi:MAG: YIP1 family protein [Rubrobacter sp.]|nr:YIP1 family protein [Rubrobacter sp.]
MDSGSDAGGQDRERGSRESEGFDMSRPVRSFVSTVRAVLFEPVGFFRRLPRRGRALNPVVFALVCALISAPFAFLAAPFDPLTGDNTPDLRDSLARLVAEPGGSVAAVIVVILAVLVLAPLLVLLGLYISAAIYHILVWIFVRPTDTGFEVTLRVVAYTSAVELLNWIPVVGLLASLYGLYLAFVGIREMHEATTGQALAVISLPVVSFVVFNVLPLSSQST